MPSTHIEINGNESRVAGDVRRFVNNLRALQNEHNRLQGILNAAYGGDDPNGLAVLLGLPQDKAMTVRSLLNAIDDEINAAQLGTVTNRLG